MPKRLLACMVVLTVAVGAPSAQDAPFDAGRAREDVNALVRYVAEHHAYWDRSAIDWPSIPKLYADDLNAVKTRSEFVSVIERIVEELHDHHAHLNTNTTSSPRLVPSGSDIWAAWQNGQARVLEVRAGSDAERAGIKRRTSGVSHMQDNRGYIRIHDSLGDADLILDFDKALAALRQTTGLILDLRDTPGGGNSTVARAILGRFVNREQPYQKHVLPSEARDTGVVRSWLELVTPRGPFRYDKPVAALVNHWTGSMGEGLAIGFDATRAGVIVGTPMAGLLGATYRFELPHSRVGVNLPAEQLFHVNGTPREAFVPPVAVDPSAPATNDAWIAKALQVI